MKIAIIGGGISGLSAAFRLSGQGHEVDVFEASPFIGGLVSTFNLDGACVEKFYHFLCRGDDGYVAMAKELGLEKGLRWAPGKTGFYHDGREYGFTSPLDLLRFSAIPFTQRLRFGLFALEARARQEWRQLDEIRAQPWLTDRLGQRAYEVVWKPLLEMKFGELHKTVSAAWVWHRVSRVAKSKGTLGYLEGGSELFYTTLVDAIRSRGARIHTSRPVRRILETNGRVQALDMVDGTVVECDQVISSAPLNILAKLLPPRWIEYAQQLEGIQYVGVVCAVMKLKRRVSKYFWLNVNDPRIACNGIIEFTNLNPNMCADGHVVYVPYYLPTTAALYTADASVAFEQSWQSLKYLNPSLKDSDLIAHEVFKAPYAQAICPTGFLDLMPQPQAPIEGLHLLDSTFLYPEDRTQSGLILKAWECADYVHGSAAGTCSVPPLKATA
jgi:protoporphyrinogen oxidase